MKMKPTALYEALVGDRKDTNLGSVIWQYIKLVSALGLQKQISATL